MSASKVKLSLKKLSSKTRALSTAKYFKTGPGEYGEGDIFIGVKTGDTRAVAKEFQHISLDEVSILLKSKIHEERTCALEILVFKYDAIENENQNLQTEYKEKSNIVKFYLSHTETINNWDLVDTSASYILGNYMFQYPVEQKRLHKLITSKKMWERRIAMVSMLYFTSHNKLVLPFNVAKHLLGDTHDLMHKAVGWVLREAGKKDEIMLKKFLRTNYKKLPRTTLRYAIERFNSTDRINYLKGNF